jgi:transglutaminase-like putative cysteine protease
MEATMLRQTVLAIGLLVLVHPASYAQQKPAYLLQSAPARKVEATYTYEVRYPNAEAKEWEMFVAKPPDMPAQSVAKVVVEPPGDDLNDASDLKQPLLHLLVRPETDAQKKTVKVVVQTEATLMTRRLIPLPAGTKAPNVPPLGEEVRKVALAAAPHLNFEDATFQKWLDTNKLRRQKKESDVDFARRVFVTIEQTMAYKRPFEHDGKASSTCQAGRGDCGCLSAVFVCALRANDIPARELVGRLVKSDKPFEKSEYGIHARAEFFADRVGWVPVDPSFGLADRSLSGLTCFGNDGGDLLVFHLDEGLVIETRSFGKATLFALQGVAVWAMGGGNLENPETKEDWRIRELPFKPQKK